MKYVKLFEELNNENFSQNFIDWIDNFDDETKEEILSALQLEGEEISKNHYNFYGDMICGVLIYTSDLFGFGTATGTVGNKCFDADVINYLKEKNVDYIVSSIFLNEPYELSHCLISFETEEDCEIFSEMIEEKKGSLTFNSDRIDNYWFFEAE